MHPAEKSNGIQETEVRRQESEDRSQKTGDRRQEAGDRRQETGGSNQHVNKHHCIPTTDYCLLIPDSSTQANKATQGLLW
jgi:hypothetical protein